MDFVKYRVKNMEPFKDGTILGGRFLKPGEVLEVSEQDYIKITNSGGIMDILDTLIPNPRKHEEPVEVLVARLEKEIAEEDAVRAKVAEVAAAEEVTYRQEVQDKLEAEKPVAKKKPGRPRKAA